MLTHKIAISALFVSALLLSGCSNHKAEPKLDYMELVDNGVYETVRVVSNESLTVDKRRITPKTIDGVIVPQERDIVKTEEDKEFTNMTFSEMGDYLQETVTPKKKSKEIVHGYRIKCAELKSSKRSKGRFTLYSYNKYKVGSTVKVYRRKSSSAIKAIILD